MPDKIQLFCLPHAGTSAFFYYAWNKRLKEKFELFPLELAGRGGRAGEDYHKDFEAAVDDAYKRLVRDIKGNYILLGHCMGGLLVYELAVRLYENDIKGPEHIIFSGQVPPDIREGLLFLGNADDHVLIEQIKKMGGNEEEPLIDDDLKDFFLPILRADCRMFDQYEMKKKIKLLCDITVLYGDKDLHNDGQNMKLWEHFTNGKCDLHELKGDHYFINYSSDKIIDILLAL
ncbi:MAG: alpha/beta fold hydrolase [Lachnospiraceae bacterium]|nr:alpha/beta fold hydrolase [Lachnospiraceae bacterium]